MPLTFVENVLTSKKDSCHISDIARDSDKVAAASFLCQWLFLNVLLLAFFLVQLKYCTLQEFCVQGNRPSFPPLLCHWCHMIWLINYLWVVMDEGAEIGRLMERIELCGLKGPSWNQSCGFMLLKLCFSFLCCCHIL